MVDVPSQPGPSTAEGPRTVEQSHKVERADEGRHPKGPERLWSESWYADFVDGDGALGGYVRLGLYPNRGVSWWTVLVVGTGRRAVSISRHDLAVPPEPGLAVAGAGARIGLDLAEPLERFGVHSTGSGEVSQDAASPWSLERGAEVAVAVDLEWATAGTPYRYEAATRYEVPCEVTGEITLGDEVLTISGQGQRDHSWGVRDWWAFSWCWAAWRFDDGTRVHLADIRIGDGIAFGYVQRPGEKVVTVERLEVETERGPDGFPKGSRIRIEPGGLEVAVEPVAFGSMPLSDDGERTRVMPRAMARFVEPRGRVGLGWVEWNSPEHPGA